MKATVDANILFSALLKSGGTRKAWFDYRLELLAPEFLLVEFEKYSSRLRQKSNKKGDFDRIYMLLISRVKLIEDKELAPYLPAAASLISDDKDWLYLACALKEDTIVWSNDQGFKAQNRVKSYTTEELLKQLETL